MGDKNRTRAKVNEQKKKVLVGYFEVELSY